jgi:hypothetical protein
LLASKKIRQIVGLVGGIRLRNEAMTFRVITAIALASANPCGSCGKG